MAKIHAATILADEIERTEREDGSAFYDAKLMSIRLMQRNGFKDEEIERMLGIRLRVEDRQDKCLAPA